MGWTTPATWASEDWNLQIRDNMSYMHAWLPPIGSITMYGANVTAPTGWVFCRGQVVSESGTYAALYDVIGNNFDTGGEGTGNFRLPNFVARFPVGGGTAGYPFGDTGGGNYDHFHPASTSGSNALTAVVYDHNGNSGNAGNHDHNFVTGQTSHDHGFVGNVAVNGRGSGNLATAGAPHNHSFSGVNVDHNHAFASHPGHQHTINHGHSAAVGGSTGWMYGNTPPDFFDFSPPFLGVEFIIRYE